MMLGSKARNLNCTCQIAQQKTTGFCPNINAYNEQSVQARYATLHFPNMLARFAAPNLVRSTSSKQIRAHPRVAFFAL